MTLVVEEWSLYHLEHVVPVNSIRSQTQEIPQRTTSLIISAAPLESCPKTTSLDISGTGLPPDGIDML